ncbi:MAG: GIY-YIG nuclease family protein [Chloroflexi bacterium]|nr:GIY-YIG nuclease family protein [Chloroflexota bacterium]
MAKKMGKTKVLSKSNLEDVPEQSGVYNLLNQKGEIIYTGSASAGRLKSRLSEHLSSASVKDAKKFQTRPLSSTAEARRVEAALIERHKPRENKRGK